MQRPRLLSHYDIRLEPGRGDQEDQLIFSSTRRTIRLAGRGFTEFLAHVVPLLDGRQTVAQIQAATAGVLTPASIEHAIRLLAAERLIEDCALEPEYADPAAIAPQWNWLHEFAGPAGEAQRKLNNATVAVIGAAGAAAHAVQALSNIGVGRIHIVDANPVGAADPYLSAAYAGANRDLGRTEVLASKYGAVPYPNPDAAIVGAQFAIGAVDAGLSALLYQLNRACLAAAVPWTSGTLAGHEILVGPTVIPGETACFLCYKMRAVAAAEDPPARFAEERALDQRRTDESGRRESLAPLASILGNLLALEAMKLIVGMAPAAAGRLLVLDALTFSTTSHVVLRKPWCPDCAR